MTLRTDKTKLQIICALIQSSALDEIIADSKEATNNGRTSCLDEEVASRLHTLAEMIISPPKHSNI